MLPFRAIASFGVEIRAFGINKTSATIIMCNNIRVIICTNNSIIVQRYVRKVVIYRTNEVC